MMNFIFTFLISFAPVATAGTADNIVYCKNGAGVSVQVTVVSAGAIFTSVRVTSGHQSTEYINRDLYSFDPKAMTLYALNEEARFSMGVLGSGIMLNVVDEIGYLARAGKIEVLTCSEGGEIE